MTQLAKDANLSLSAMSKIEKGVRRLNQNQLLSLTKLLGCKIADIFVKESDDAAKEWQSEMKKRLSSNEDNGLKIFGAGLRALRKAADITISAAAQRAGMTLSVYHKIEVGQRGLFTDEAEPLAKIFKMTAAEMFKKISLMYKDGELGNFIEKTGEKVKQVLVPGETLSGVSLSGALYGANIYDSVRKKLVPVFAEPDDKGAVQFQCGDEKMIAAPIELIGRGGIYAVIPNPKLIGPIFPARAYLFADTMAVAAEGDFAIYIGEDFQSLKESGGRAHARVVLVDIDAKGKLIGRAADEVVMIKNAAGRLHKVVQIVME
jgi:transcriptional regulator with XRE-family HTH domain